MSNQINKIVKCRVTGLSKFGAFVVFDNDKIGMIHISEMQDTYLEDISNVLKVGDVVDALVLSVSGDGKYSLTMKPSKMDVSLEQVLIKEKDNNKENKTANLSSPGDFVWDNSEKEDQTFEEMMKKFKRTSEEKMSDLKRGENRGYSRKRGNR